MKMKVKKLNAVVLAMLLVLSLAACSKEKSDLESSKTDTPAATDAKVTLVYAEVNPAESLMGKTAIEFKTKVEELSGLLLLS